MRLFKLVLPLIPVLLIAAACSQDKVQTSAPSESEAPEVTATADSTAPLSAEEEAAAPREDLADALYLMLLDDEWPEAIDQTHLGCLAEGVVGVFSDSRLAELGMDAASVTDAYDDRGPYGLGDVFEISDQEASEVVDQALECVDWRAFVAAVMAEEGGWPDQADCIAGRISDEGLRSLVSNSLVFESQDDFGQFEAEIQQALPACIGSGVGGDGGLQEMFFNFLTQTGISAESAQCVVDGTPDEMIQLLLGLDTSGEVLPPPGFDLSELQNQCLTPEEIQSMN